MDTSPKSNGSNEWQDTDTASSNTGGSFEGGSFESGTSSTNATSHHQPEVGSPDSFGDGAADRSLTAAAFLETGERIPSFDSERSGATFANDPSVTASPGKSHSRWHSPDDIPSGVVSQPELEEPPLSASSIANRRGKRPEPVRFLDPNVRVQAKAVTVPKPSGPEAREEWRGGSMGCNEKLLNILVKLELLPAIVSLRATVQPNADPAEAFKAARQAQKALALAQQKGADEALIGQCKYYMAVASFASGNDLNNTVKMFGEALEAKGVAPEGDWADGWIDYIREQQEEQRLQSLDKPNSRPNSLLGYIASWNPLTMLRSSASSSRPTTSAQPSPSRAGLYEQMAGPRREILATKPAAKRMMLSSGSSGHIPSPKPPSRPARPPPHAHRLPSFRSDQSSRPVSREKVPLRYPRSGGPRDSQGNFTHLNSDLKYNEARPYGVDTPFVLSPEQYDKSSPPPPPPPPPSPPESPPKQIRYRIVNPDPSSSSSGSDATAAVGANRSLNSQQSHEAQDPAVGVTARDFAAEEEHDVSPRRRRTSWIQRMGISVSETGGGSPTKSLEAMAEEGESPMFKPRGFGELGK